MNRSVLLVVICLCGVLFFAFPTFVFGQADLVLLPDGTNISVNGRAGFSSNTYYYDHGDEDGDDWRSTWSPPRGRHIIDAYPKKGSIGTYFILLDDGSVYEDAGFFFQSITFRTKLVSASFSEGWDKLIGDDLYVLSSSYVYVSHDTAKTWSLDSTGLGNAHVWDIAIDSTQIVYAATDKGLYTQALNSSTWIKSGTFSLNNNLFKGFIDRRNRIYLLGNSSGVYKSTNNGSTWNIDTAGIGTTSVNCFGDDSLGNIYAGTSANGTIPNAIYKSPGGTTAWTRIDQPILAVTQNPPKYNSIGGNKVLWAGTSFGLFKSTDQGATWSPTSSQIRAEAAGSFVKGQANRNFVATALGIFKKDPADPSWSKVYPASGYNGALSISGDRLGNLYIFTGTTINGGPILNKSTDNGVTWNLDTAGVYQVRTGVLAFDEAGGQHVGTSQYGSSFKTMMFYKPLGGSWAPDSNGFNSTNLSFTSSLTSDYHGTMYASGSYYSGSTPVNGKVLRKPISGGSWTVDTSGMPSNVNYFNILTPDKAGNMFGLAGAIASRHSGGSWSPLTGPTIPGSLISSLRMSVDSSGAIFAATFGSDAHFVSRGLGVYFSTDAGTTWKFAGGDSISFTGLISYGDTTFGYSQNGLFKFTRKPASGIISPSSGIPANYTLDQNYPNPFNPTTVISYELQVKGLVTLSLYDILGRKVSTLVDQEQPGGKHSVSWDGANFSSGVYFYQLRSGNFVESKKMILMK